jgi:hypothetical protein
MRPYAPLLAHSHPTLGSALQLARVLRPIKWDLFNGKWDLSNGEPHHHPALFLAAKDPLYLHGIGYAT